MKAQKVKNAVIVPVGSKGGFFVKQLPSAGAATRERSGPKASPLPDAVPRPARHDRQHRGERHRGRPNVVRHDDDDPYLVVAADKGTATFSDIANGARPTTASGSDDAFASGGSAGYDHKAMGITARGAWEAVKRHFRELGQDIQTKPFTVRRRRRHVGRRVRQRHAAVGADQADRRLRPPRHLHRSRIPIRRRPWPSAKRLFDLPRSSWNDYDKR